MDDDMFSMLNATKRVRKTKTGATTSKSAGKRRATSSSDEDAEEEKIVATDRPSDRKRTRTDGPGNVDPMAALEDLADEDMEKSADVGDVSVDVVLPTDGPKAPVVTDDFEQEAEREVAATSGFAKVEEGEKMRLVHQVRHQVSFIERGSVIFHRLPILIML
jgi:hypothetical protein